MSAGQLIDEHNQFNLVSVDPVRCIFQENAIRYIAAKNPALNNMKIWKTVVKDAWNMGHNWSQIIFSYERKIELHSNKKKSGRGEFVRKPNGEKKDRQYTSKTV